MTNLSLHLGKSTPTKSYGNEVRRPIFYCLSSLATTPFIAIFLLLCILGFKQKPPQHRNPTGLNGSILGTLKTEVSPYGLTGSDRSLIWVESYSKLTVLKLPIKKIRYILNGQARFKVLRICPGKESRVIVETQRMSIRVLDTTRSSEFVVRDLEGQSTASVATLSGKISVSNGRNSTILVAKQWVSVTKNPTSLSLVKHLTIPDTTFQKSKLFDFSESTIPQAIDSILTLYGFHPVQIEKGIDTVTVGKWKPIWYYGNQPLRDLLTSMSNDRIDFKVKDDTIKVCKKIQK